MDCQKNIKRAQITHIKRFFCLLHSSVYGGIQVESLAKIYGTACRRFGGASGGAKKERRHRSRFRWRQGPLPGAGLLEKLPLLVLSLTITAIGGSFFIGPEKTTRTWRTRAGITLVEDLIAGGKVTPDQVQNMLYAHRNYAAGVLLDDVLQACDLQVNKNAEEIAASCEVLNKWDRRQTNESRGAQVWTEFWREVRNTKDLYTRAFDPEDPVYTPRGINVSNPDVVKAVHGALVTAQTRLNEANIPLDAPWGEIQYAERHNQRIPIPGGQGWAGMFSMIVADLKPDQGYTPIVHGNSYVQVISWDKDGQLDARGILTYSQSEESDSPHYSDQTELYSRGEWLKFPFADAEIAADPNLISLRLTE